MRVRHLLIENLGPLERVDLDLRPVTVLMGPNEAGKSFVLDALAVLRYGTCRGLKANESLALARNGSKGWAIEATLCVNPEAEDLVLRRTRSAGPDTATLDGAMGDARVWRALLNGTSFVALSPAERKTLVADLTARDTSDLLGRVVNAPEPIRKAVAEGDLRRAHRLACEERRAIDRVLREQEAIVSAGAEDPEVATKSGMKRVSTIPRETIDRALESARAAWRRALDAAASAKAHADARADAAAARAELEGLGAPVVLLEGDTRRLGEVNGTLAKKEREHADLGASSRSARQEAEKVEARLSNAAAPCPTCEQPLSPAAVEAIKARAQALREEATKAAEAMVRLAGEVETLKKERDSLREKAEKARTDGAARAACERRIKAAGAAAEEVSGEDPEPLEREVRRLEALRDARVRYDGRAEALAGAQKRVEDLRARSEAATAIEEAVVPDRIDDEAATLERLNEACREFAPQVMGGPFVRVGNDWEVSYAGHRIELASDSALIRTGLVLALALSRLSGVGCVFVDRLEALDDSTRARVVNLLGALAEKGEVQTAIVATVRKEPPAPAAVPEWLGRVWVEGGKARAI